MWEDGLWHPNEDDFQCCQWRIQDFPLGGAEPLGGGTDLQRRCFLAKTNMKTKELDPVVGGAPAVPPGAANGCTP